MSSLDLLDLRDLSSPAAVERLVELQGHDFETHCITLDLALRRPPEPAAGALLAQFVLGAPEDLRFVVHLPDSEALIGALVKSGVASALASRRESVHYEPTVPHFEDHNPWHSWHAWTPGAHQAMAPMFHRGEAASGLFGPTHAVFVNPHITTDPAEPASLTRLLRRWLTQTVAPELEQAERLSVIEVPAFAIDQLLRNVSEHAVTPSSPLIDSIVQVEVIEPERAGGRFLQITVLDTGAGVSNTLRPKLEVPGSVSDAALLGALLHGELPGWGRGRGFGLSTLADHVISQAGARFELWSGATRVIAEEQIEAHALGEAAVLGTVATVRFPLPAH